ncbi:MAG: 1-hydroxycarotenoid 3,4-desaturase CrtD [Pseudomonadota bacterium]
MTGERSAAQVQDHVIVIGAGVGGLASAMRLAHHGLKVTVLERHGTPGGKMRALPSAAGSVDTGPTVLTMKPVFDTLFQDVGARLEDHVTLVPQPIIARHFWTDGAQLDFFNDETANIDAVKAFAGARAADQFARFSKRARELFEAFYDPVIASAKPTFYGLMQRMLADPSLAWKMAPFSTLAGLLKQSFDDPRLAQLFGRYATYVGGAPDRAPALLSLIWQAEAAGVWAVQGGMHHLAQTMAEIALTRGAEIHYGADVDEILASSGQITGVRLTTGETLVADRVVFNGDPRALSLGRLGPAVDQIAPQTKRLPRSLSADVWGFAARVSGQELCHHNVFFRDDPMPEFDALARGERLSDPTLYLCAMDRGLDQPTPTLERFEIIANAPPLTVAADEIDKKEARCRVFETLERFGCQFSPLPAVEALSTPTIFEQLFPATAGSLYGQTPHGTMAAFQRPTARTALRGLYLAGGGTHPGAGLPMATLSGQHAAEAILTDRISTSTSRRTATHGGMSMASATVADARSASSGL